MRDFERREYGDPEAVAIRREEQTCKGCQSIETIKAFGAEHEICDDGKQKARRRRKYKAKGLTK